MSALERIGEHVEITHTPNKEGSEAEESAYKRLTAAQIALILQLDAAGKTQTEVAEIIGVTQATISRTLAKFNSTIDLAKKHLEAKAMKAAEAWEQSLAPAAEKGDHKPAKELLQAIGVVQKDAAATQTAVQVNVGMPGSPALSDPFADPG